MGITHTERKLAYHEWIAWLQREIQRGMAFPRRGGPLVRVVAAPELPPGTAVLASGTQIVRFVNIGSPPTVLQSRPGPAEEGTP